MLRFHVASRFSSHHLHVQKAIAPSLLARIGDCQRQSETTSIQAFNDTPATRAISTALTHLMSVHKQQASVSRASNVQRVEIS